MFLPCSLVLSTTFVITVVPILTISYNFTISLQWTFLKQPHNCAGHKGQVSLRSVPLVSTGCCWLTQVPSRRFVKYSSCILSAVVISGNQRFTSLVLLAMCALLSSPPWAPCEAFLGSKCHSYTKSPATFFLGGMYSFV